MEKLDVIKSSYEFEFGTILDICASHQYETSLVFGDENTMIKDSDNKYL